MDSESIETKKYLITWWDLVDHYLLAAMLVVSLGSFGLQSTQDRLICIPAVNRSPITAGNDSALRNRSSSSVVSLFKLPDRRHYDYVDNECYAKMDRFSAYYSLIFFAETVILLAISNFWLKCPDCVNALAHSEHLISEFLKGEFSFRDKERPEIMKRLHIFQACYSQKITKFKLSSFTWQYRLRGVVGLFATIAAILLNAIYYPLSTGWTQCHLDGLVAFSATHRFLQCTRSIGTYFYLGLNLFCLGLSLHLIFVSWAFYWSITGERRGPTYKMSPPLIGTLQFEGDAAFLFHFILYSNYGRFVRYMYEEEKQRRKKGKPRESKRENQQVEAAAPLDPEG